MKDCIEVDVMPKDKNTLLSAFSTAASISFYLVSFVAAGILLGRFVDGYFAIVPWGTVCGIVLGMIAGMWSIYKKVVGGK
jgi:ATP synthase protein I